MENTYKYKLQGDGRDSWEVTEWASEGVMINKYMVYENPVKPNWKQLKTNLFHSPLFGRAISEAQPNAYSTLLQIFIDGANGDTDEETFLQVFNMLGMTFSVDEKTELNGYFETNNFTIRL